MSSCALIELITSPAAVLRNINCKRDDSEDTYRTCSPCWHINHRNHYLLLDYHRVMIVAGGTEIKKLLLHWRLLVPFIVFFLKLLSQANIGVRTSTSACFSWHLNVEKDTVVQKKSSRCFGSSLCPHAESSAPVRVTLSWNCGCATRSFWISSDFWSSWPLTFQFVLPRVACFFFCLLSISQSSGKQCDMKERNLCHWDSK